MIRAGNILTETLVEAIDLAGMEKYVQVWRYTCSKFIVLLFGHFQFFRNLAQETESSMLNHKGQKKPKVVNQQLLGVGQAYSIGEISVWLKHCARTNRIKVFGSFQIVKNQRQGTKPKIFKRRLVLN